MLSLLSYLSLCYIIMKGCEKKKIVIMKGYEDKPIIIINLFVSFHGLNPFF